MKKLSVLAQRRRIILFRNIFKSISQLNCQGMPFMIAVKKLSMAYNGRALPGGGRFMCSPGTITRMWYRTRQGADEAGFKDLRLEKHQNQKIPRQVIVELRRIALQSGISCTEVYRAAGGKDELGFSYPTLVRYIGKSVKEAVKHRIGVKRLCVMLENKKREWEKYVEETIGSESGNGQKLDSRGNRRRLNAIRSGDMQSKQTKISRTVKRKQNRNGSLVAARST